MARKISIGCDFPGCTADAGVAGVAGDLQNWGQRDVIDSVKVLLASDEAIHRFDARTTQYTSPKHRDHVDDLPSPPLHPQVVEFLAQAERDWEAKRKRDAAAAQDAAAGG